MLANDKRLMTNAYFKYFPNINCSFSFVAVGILAGSVRIAFASARPHLQERAFGIAATVAVHDFRGVLGVLHQHGNNLLHRHGIMMRMPAVIIGHHGDGDVANLRFARELRFL